MELVMSCAMEMLESFVVFICSKVFCEAKYDDGLVFSDRLIRKCWGASGTLYVNTVLKPY